MAKRKRVTKKATRKAAAKGAPPLSLAQFGKQVRTRLSRLEREIQRAPATKQLTRMLRDASHQLGKWEATGEKRWKKLTANARADALKLLKRIEKAIAPPPPKPKPAAAVPRPAAPAPKPVIPAQRPVAPPVPRPATPASTPASVPPMRPPYSTPSNVPGRGEGQGGQGS
jgi:hypothetical protein